MEQKAISLSLFFSFKTQQTKRKAGCRSVWGMMGWGRENCSSGEFMSHEEFFGGELEISQQSFITPSQGSRSLFSSRSSLTSLPELLEIWDRLQRSLVLLTYTSYLSISVRLTGRNQWSLKWDPTDWLVCPGIQKHSSRFCQRSLLISHVRECVKWRKYTGSCCSGAMFPLSFGCVCRASFYKPSFLVTLRLFFLCFQFQFLIDLRSSFCSFQPVLPSIIVIIIVFLTLSPSSLHFLCYGAFCSIADIRNSQNTFGSCYFCALTSLRSY